MISVNCQSEEEHSTLENFIHDFDNDERDGSGPRSSFPRDLDKDERVGKSSAGHLSDDAVVTVTASNNDPRDDLGERPK